MSTITFENGKSVTFDGIPTADDIEEVASQFSEQPQKGVEKSPDKTVIPTITSGLIGAQGSSVKEEGIIPALIGAASGASGGALGMFLNNPKSSTMAGLIGSSIASGEDLSRLFTKAEDTDKSLYSPKTLGGLVTMLATEIAAGGSEGVGLLDKFNRLEKVPGAVERLASAKLWSKARGEYSQLVPEIKLSSDIKNNRPTTAITEGVNLLKKTNNPIDVVNKVRVEKQSVINEVNNLVDKFNKPVNPDFVGSRAKLILERDLRNATASERKKILSAFQDEAKWIGEQEVFDTKTINERKRFLYEETQNIQKKQSQGKTIVTSPEKDKVKDAFAQAYKESVEAANPEIKKLNERYGSLETLHEAVSKMAERTIEAGSLAERIITQIIGRTNTKNVAAAGIREIPQVLRSFGRTTGKIEALAKESSNLLAKSRQLQGERLLATFLKEKNMAMPNPEYMKNLITSEDIKSLTNLGD